MNRRSDRFLVPLLLGLTGLSGVVDAISFLGLGHVFVANMTGNIVFLAFALAGAADLNLTGQLIALAAFFLGAVGGGRLALVVGHHRGRHLAVSAWTSAGLVAAGLVTASVGAGPAATRTITAMLGLAMGVQNATTRKLAVANLATNVVTMTITGIAIGVWNAGDRERQRRRVGAVVAMFLGALTGGLLVVHAGLRWALLLALLVVVTTAVTVTWLSRRTPESSWSA